MGDVRFGPYVLLERVSVGGMAEVFRARRASEGSSGKLLAVKRILPSMIEDDAFRLMFTDEANISGQLVHRNIARIYENGTADSYPYIAMEYVWGKDLLQIQNRFRRLRQRMPVAMACHIAIKMCEALDYAHRKLDAKGKPMLIVHRDCTPQNVIVSYKGEVKLVDFGIAKAAERLTMTAAGDVKGKLSYLAPEQVAGAPLDRRVDVYGAGVVLFELLIGDRLISANSEVELMAKARAGILPRPREVMPDLPAALEDIILTAVARDPAKRYGWCSELRNALVAFLSETGQAFDSDDLSIWLKGAFAQEIMAESQDLETLPTFEGQLGPSEFDDHTVADVAGAGPLGLAVGKAPLVKEFAVAAASGTASRRMAATIPRAEVGARSAASSHPPQLGGVGEVASVPASPTMVLPRITGAPPVGEATSAQDEATRMAAAPMAAGSVTNATRAAPAAASVATPEEGDELEETAARIAVVVAPMEQAAPTHAASAAKPAVAPTLVRRSASIAPAVTATVKMTQAAPRRGLWLGVAIGVAIAAIVLLVLAIMLA
ncbi:MAG: serine/threonine protein kinase [Myxococcales bacterium]|nr:serine/threonine protein kinase [Myxococcales bacterium]